MYRQKSSGKSNAIRDRYHRSRQTDGRETPHRGLFFLFASFAILMTGVSWLGCNKTTILAGVCALVRLISSTVAFHPPGKATRNPLGLGSVGISPWLPRPPRGKNSTPIRRSVDVASVLRIIRASAPVVVASASHAFGYFGIQDLWRLADAGCLRLRFAVPSPTVHVVEDFHIKLNSFLLLVRSAPEHGTRGFRFPFWEGIEMHCRGQIAVNF